MEKSWDEIPSAIKTYQAIGCNGEAQCNTHECKSSTMGMEKQGAKQTRGPFAKLSEVPDARTCLAMRLMLFMPDVLVSCSAIACALSRIR